MQTCAYDDEKTCMPVDEEEHCGKVAVKKAMLVQCAAMRDAERFPYGLRERAMDRGESDGP